MAALQFGDGRDELPDAGTIPPSPWTNSRNTARVASPAFAASAAGSLNGRIVKFPRNGSNPLLYFTLSIIERAPYVRPWKAFVKEMISLFPLVDPHSLAILIAPSIPSVPLFEKKTFLNPVCFRNNSASSSAASVTK